MIEAVSVLQPHPHLCWGGGVYGHVSSFCFFLWPNRWVRCWCEMYSATMEARHVPAPRGGVQNCCKTLPLTERTDKHYQIIENLTKMFQQHQKATRGLRVVWKPAFISHACAHVHVCEELQLLEKAWLLSLNSLQQQRGGVRGSDQFPRLALANPSGSLSPQAPAPR